MNKPSLLQRNRRLPRAPRAILGYHGCSQETAEKVLAAGRFTPSTRAYDWLGEGIYFWEYAPYRALEWAIQKCATEGGEPAVLRATIQLRRCLNLLDIGPIPGLSQAYRLFVDRLDGKPLPINTARGAHFLDRAVIDFYCHETAQQTAASFQTVRGSFAEGEPIYPGSKILTKAHTQIAVRDAACIVRLSLVEFP